MRLLLATDHVFTKFNGRIHDAYCFGDDFFADYREVFDEVVVAARVAEPGSALGTPLTSSGLRFAELPDVHGSVWHLVPSRLIGSSIVRNVAASDAVCVRMPSASGWVAAQAAFKQGKPLMFEIIGDPLAAVTFKTHGPAAAGAALAALRQRRVARRASMGSYVSYRHLQRRYPARNGATTDAISSIRLPDNALQPARSWGTQAVPLKVISVASFVPVKSQEVIIRASRLATEKEVPIHLTFIGDGPTLRSMKDLTRELGISEKSSFLGHISDRQTINDALDRSDLFVLGSRTEGMPRSILEAMARGLPIVGTNAGGTSEILEPEQLFGVGDEEALAQLFLRLAMRPDLLRRFSEHSEKTVQEFVSSRLSLKRRRLYFALAGSVQ